MTATKLANILGFTPTPEQVKAIKELFKPAFVKEIQDYDPEFYLTPHDYFFIKHLKEEVSKCYE